MVITHTPMDIIDWEAMRITFQFTPEAERVLGQQLLFSNYKSETTTKVFILATGTRRRRLKVPGEHEFDGKGVSYSVACDGPLYKGKKVAVVGGGNSAVMEALFLDSCQCREVYLIHRRNQLRAAKPFEKNILENSRVKIIWDTIVTEIHGNKLSVVLGTERVP